MTSDAGRGRDHDDDDLIAEPPAFSDDGLRRTVYGQDQRMVNDALSGRAPDRRSRAFDEDTEALQATLTRRRSLVPVITALAAVVCFGAVVWYAYNWGTGQVESDELPVVRAEPMPEKVRPEQPGGMEVPHQGIAVLNGEGEAPQTVERLLPRPETPAPPEPLPETEAPAAEALPETIPEAPAMADGSAADVTEAPDLGPDEGAMAEVPAAEGGIARPQPKPEGGARDQIAELLESGPLETADGGKAETAEAPAEPAEAAPAQTAPVQTAPVQTAPAQTAKAAPGDVVLQLSSVKSETAAAQEWKRLQGAYPDLLGKLGLSLETAAVQGTTYYRVQTGPFASRAAAADVCAKLKARNQDCLVKQR